MGNIIEGCIEDKHDFADVYTVSCGENSIIIRWCRTCGSIVVDLEKDGKLYPDYEQKIVLPSLVKEYIKELEEK